MIRIAIDPGISTGIAINKDGQYSTLTLSIEQTHDGKLTDLITVCDEIIYENFVGYASHQMKVDTNGFETVRIIGGILEVCRQQKKPAFKRAAQNRLAFMKKAKDKFKNKEVDCIRPTRHETDALAHLLSYEWQVEH